MAPETMLSYDPEETNRQITHFIEMRRIKRNRLFVLQRQAAQHGPNVDAHIPTEINELDSEINDLSLKIVALEQANEEQRQREREAKPEASTLTPVLIVPQTINERLLAMTFLIESTQTEMRRGFAGVHGAVNNNSDLLRKDDERTRELIKSETAAREEWQEGAAERRKDDMQLRADQHEKITHWLWIGGWILIVLVMVLLLYVAIDTMRTFASITFTA